MSEHPVGSVPPGTYVPIAGAATITGQKDFTTAPTVNGVAIGGASVVQPTAPTVAASLLLSQLEVRYGHIQGRYAYVSQLGGHFYVIDISRPTVPVVVGDMVSATLNSSYGLRVVGRYAYVACDIASGGPGGRLAIIDVSNPTSPTLVTTVTAASMLTCRDVEIVGNVAYVLNGASNATDITAIDVSNPTKPVVLGSVPTTISGGEWLRARGRWLFAGGGSAFQSLDLGNSASSRTVADGVTNSTTTVTSATMAFTYADKGAGITGGGIPNGATIVTVNSATSVVISAAATVTAGSVSLTVLRSGLPTVAFSSTSIGGLSMHIEGRYGYLARGVTSGIKVVDLADPTAVTSVATLADAAHMFDPLGIWAQGKYCYVTSQSGDSLTVLNISNPAVPVYAGTIRDDTNLYHSWQVFAAGRYAYVVVPGTGRFTVIDLGANETPTQRVDTLQAGAAWVDGDLYVGGKVYTSENSRSDQAAERAKVGPYRFRTGRYYTINVLAGGSNANAALAPTISAVPFLVGETTDFDQLALEVQTVGSAGSLVRLGIFTDVAVKPGALFLDGGTFDGTVLGVGSVSITARLAPGLWWLAAASQGSPGTHPLVRTIVPSTGVPLPIIGQSSAAFANPGVMWSGQSAASGALPGFFLGTSTATNGPTIFIRAA